LAVNAQLTVQILMAAFLRFFAKKVTANICPFEPFVMAFIYSSKVEQKLNETAMQIIEENRHA
jgi:hypothetical protein